MRNSLVLPGILCLGSVAFSQTPAVNIVKDIDGDSSSSPVRLTASGSNLYFVAQTAAEGNELWVSDGTGAGTHLVTNLSPDIGSVNSTLVVETAPLPGGNMAFSASAGATFDIELYGASPTSAALIKDINPSSFSFPQSLKNVGSYVYFRADDGTNGTEAWITDGTTSGTQMLGDINAGGDSSPGGFTGFGSQVYFAATDDIGTHLYKTTSTPGNISQVGSSSVFATGDMAVANGKLFFSGSDTTSENTGSELYVTDGSTITRVADINAGAGDSTPTAIKTIGSQVIFTADDGANGIQLFRASDTDATRVSTGLSNITDLTIAGNKAFFTADDGTHGQELFVYDLLTDSVNLVKDIAGGTDSYFPRNLLAIDDKIFFVTDQDMGDGNFAEKLWWTDGTDACTQVVYDQPGLASGVQSLGGLTAIADTLYFSGATTSVDGFSSNVELLSVVVPEPGMIGLLSLGALPLLRRRRARA